VPLRALRASRSALRWVDLLWNGGTDSDFDTVWAKGKEWRDRKLSVGRIVRCTILAAHLPLRAGTELYSQERFRVPSLGARGRVTLFRVYFRSPIICDPEAKKAGKCRIETVKVSDFTIFAIPQQLDGEQGLSRTTTCQGILHHAKIRYDARSDRSKTVHETSSSRE